MRFGLSAKFISLITVVLAVVFAAVIGLVIATNTVRLRDGLRNEAQAFAALAVKPIGNAYVLYADSGTVRIGQAIDRFTSLDGNISNVRVVDVQGRVLFDQRRVSAGSVSSADAASFSPVYTNDSGGNLARVVYPYIEDSGLHRYAVVFYVSAAAINATIIQTAWIILLAGLFSLALAAGITYLFINRFLLRPIKRISYTSTLIRAGQYDQRIELATGRRDELGDLALSLNEMADRLKSDIDKLKEVDELKSEFMMIASHNLRTPLTIISGSVDVILSENPSGAIKKMSESIAASSQRLGAFAEDMLAIAGLEAGRDIFSLSESRAADIFTTSSRFDTLAKEKGLKYITDIQTGDRLMMASVTHLRSAIWNLLDNAIKFTESGGTITLTARPDGDRLIISIADNGAGITPEEIPKLFTKFHRGTSLLHYDYEGTGIGLYLTKLIIDNHHGTIDVTSQLGRGTTVTITLPLMPAGPQPAQPQPQPPLMPAGQ